MPGPMRAALRFGIALLVAQWGVTRDIAAQDAPAQKKESRQSVTQPATQPGKKVTSRQSSPTKRPAKPPIGSKEALALARRVVAYAGGRKGLSAVHNLIFTSTEEEYRVRALWDRKTKRVRLEILQLPKPMRRRQGRPFIFVHDLAKGTDVLCVPGRDVEVIQGRNKRPMRAARKSGRAEGLLYWHPLALPLLGPLQVLDRGVHVSIEPRKEEDAADMQRLGVRFQGLGLKYGDQSTYVMHVKRGSGRVMRWERFLTRRDRFGRTYSFEDYRRVGRLMLSLTRREVGEGDPRSSARFFRYTDVAINVPLPEDVWTAKKLILPTIGVQAAASKPSKEPDKPAANQPRK